MKRLSRFIAILLVLLTAVCTLSVPASAVSFPCDVEHFSDSLLMMNLDTDMEVYAKDADVRRYPAALTKVMSYIVAAEYYDDFDQKITVKQSCIDKVISEGMYCSGVDWYVGEAMTVTDLLYAMMLPIGHDATMVLADDVGQGDLQIFVDKMNDKAQELGCKDTHFTNPFGTHDDDHYSTARDLYLITKYAMGLPLFSKIVNSSTYYASVDKQEENPFITTNWMVDPGRGGNYYYMYATGVKNGTTTQAGRCLIATAVYDGYAYMCICLHAPYDDNADENEQYCMIEAANMFRWAFLGLSFVTPVTRDTPVCEQAVDHAWDTKSILLTPESDLNIILPYDYSDADVKITPDNTDSVSAPIKKGDIVTTATVSYKGEAFTKINLVAGEDVGVSPILYTTDAIRGVLTSPWFLLAVGIVVVLFIIFVTVSSSYAKKKRDKKRR